MSAGGADWWQVAQWDEERWIDECNELVNRLEIDQDEIYQGCTSTGEATASVDRA